MADSLRRQLQEERRERQRLERELEAVRASTSFRVGHALVRTAKRLGGRRRARSSAPDAPAARDPQKDATSPGKTGERDDSTSATSAPAARTARRADSAAGRPTGVLVDATRAGASATREVVRQLLDEGRQVQVVHPAPLDDLGGGATQEVADEVSDELERQYGAARSLRLVEGEGAARALLQRGVRPLVQVADEDASAEGLPAGPVFIGGTGRSGTWVLGRMLAAHEHFHTVHTELRFHSARPGFAAVLQGEMTPADFAEVVQRKWLRPRGGSGNPKGLQLITGNRELQRHLARFVERAEEDVPEALGQLMLDVVGPYARSRGALRWAETTPDNASAAAALTTALPTAKVIHSIRDGRDVAASVVTMPWGPDDHLEALAWWANRIRRADAGMRAAGPGRTHTLRLEELLHLDREATYASLIEFLEYTDDEAVQWYFREEMDGTRGNVGRWREALDAQQRDAFVGRYRELVAELEDEGVTSLPTPSDEVDKLAM